MVVGEVGSGVIANASVAISALCNVVQAKVLLQCSVS